MPRLYARYVNGHPFPKEHALVSPVDQSEQKNWSQCVCGMHSWGGGIADDEVRLSFARHIAQNTRNDVL